MDDNVIQLFMQLFNTFFILINSKSIKLVGLTEPVSCLDIMLFFFLIVIVGWAIRLYFGGDNT